METAKTNGIDASEAPPPQSAPDWTSLAEEARALIAATAEVAGDQVEQARSRLTAALDQGRRLGERVREQAVESTEAAGAVVRAHPYQAIALGAGIGALVGYLFARRCTHHPD